ncbi:hypothetical protein H4P1_00078 (plasmid) [Variovorax sp. PBS-H4]|uniref:hypothetical protein n=1 Tax=Variovorax sp. PBS-H4 TaxID=434008 RepID=UPI001316807E|nr:hypothetical protein [Variovorax sp. PBS-H4]VTU41459.1 hypothetical protein H4P1_00078 [Variovorax sp. PBS-H4]
MNVYPWIFAVFALGFVVLSFVTPYWWLGIFAVGGLLLVLFNRNRAKKRLAARDGHN